MNIQLDVICADFTDLITCVVFMTNLYSVHQVMTDSMLVDNITHKQPHYISAQYLFTPQSSYITSSLTSGHSLLSSDH